MEKPNEVFRTQEEALWDNYQQAHNHSVEIAAYELLKLIQVDGKPYQKDGDKLLELQSEIREAYKTLNLAFAGKLIGKYKLVK